ncbi:MAG: hypothetical protein Q7S81_02695 [bacterium]|nr:hypothetical protein [bacterium]
MDMVYGVYMVTRAEIVIKPWDQKTQKVFECDLQGEDNHKLYFQIYFETGPEPLKKYEAVKSYMVKGALLEIEFAYRWYNDGLYLCLATFKKASAFRCGSDSLYEGPITAEEYFNVNRGYWVSYKTSGEWVQFPGVISLGGETVIPMNPQTSEKPKFISYLAAKESEYALVWVKRSENRWEILKKLFCFKK